MASCANSGTRAGEDRVRSGDERRGPRTFANRLDDVGYRGHSEMPLRRRTLPRSKERREAESECSMSRTRSRSGLRLGTLPSWPPDDPTRAPFFRSDARPRSRSGLRNFRAAHGRSYPGSTIPAARARRSLRRHPPSRAIRRYAAASSRRRSDSIPSAPSLIAPEPRQVVWRPSPGMSRPARSRRSRGAPVGAVLAYSTSARLLWPTPPCSRRMPSPRRAQLLHRSLAGAHDPPTAASPTALV